MKHNKLHAQRKAFPLRFLVFSEETNDEETNYKRRLNPSRIATLKAE